MKKKVYWSIILVIAIAVVAIILVSRVKEKTPEDVLVRVDDAIITADDFRKEWRRHLSAPMGMPPEGVDSFLEDMVAEKLFLSEARRRKIDRDERFQREVEKYREQLMVEALLNEEVLTVRPPIQTEIEEYWAGNKDLFSVPELARISHILVKPREGETEDETLERCRGILGRLDKKEDFAELAQEVSQGGSSVQGGDLGYFRPGQLSPELESQTRTLDVGEVSDPIKTEYGYHIMKVADRKPARDKNLDECHKEVIEALLAQKRKTKFNTLKSQLRAEAFIWKNEELLNRLRSELERPTQ